jgi:subtilisin family serine protease
MYESIGAGRFFRTLLLVVAALGAGLTAQAETADAVVPGEVVVKLRSGNDLQGVLISHRMTLAGRFGTRPIYRLKIVGATLVSTKVAALARDPRVLLAEPNYLSSSPEARKRTVWAIGQASAYSAQWAPKALDLAAAQRETRGEGVRVAVLDTGVDARHPALAPKLIAGRDFVDGDADPSEVGVPGLGAYGHGTHVAGLVALVAPAARIMPLRVLDETGLGSSWVVAEALLHAVDPDGVAATDDGAHVINLSLGTTRRTRLLDVAVELVTCSDDDDDEPDDDYSDPGYNQDKERCNLGRGSVVIAAAGNGASATELHFPAAEHAEGALSVAATTSTWRIAGFSNRGPWIQAGAPGVGITSTLPGGGYGVWSGTSMAAPLTAGVAALVLARNPDWKPVDVTKRILDRSVPLCGSAIRGVHAAGAVLDFVPPPTCP